MSIRIETRSALILSSTALAKVIFLMVVIVQGAGLCRVPIELFTVGMLGMTLAIVLGSTNPLLQLILGRKWPEADHAVYRWPSIVDGLGSMVIGIIGALEAWGAISGNIGLLRYVNIPVGF